MARFVDLVVDGGVLPDRVLRRVVRQLLRRRLATTTSGGVEDRSARERTLVRELSAAPVTVAVEDANAQHYEVPTDLFELMLGPHLKYSSGLWPPGVVDLAGAEEAMLTLTCERAGLVDGQDVLELGCGWGSLTLWMAEQYPRSRIVAVSNSATQRRHIEHEAARRGLGNVTVLTGDVGRLGVHDHTEIVAANRFDRVMSVELFEHVRNHRVLTRRVAEWLRPGGVLFVHVFVHAGDAYLFEDESHGDWMARHYFTGGMMPSNDWLPVVVRDLDLEARWALSGRHYARTLAAWLQRLDLHHDRALALFAATDGTRRARVRLRRWRTFIIACEELFAFRGGDEWHLGHYRFVRS